MLSNKKAPDNRFLIATKTTKTTKTIQTTPKLLYKTHNPDNIQSLDIENLDGVTSARCLFIQPNTRQRSWHSNLILYRQDLYCLAMQIYPLTTQASLKYEEVTDTIMPNWGELRARDVISVVAGG